MAKKIIGSLKLQVKAGQANPSPPVGPALGQRGLNIMAFVKEFNAKTADLPPGTPTPTIITYYVDKSFSIQQPLSNSLLPAIRANRNPLASAYCICFFIGFAAA